MQAESKGILAIWHDLDPAGADDFREWHTREHILERLAVPGFELGVRYEAVDSEPVVFNYYQTESPTILTSEAYLERLNDPSEWTQRIMPVLRNVYRAAGREVTCLGAGQGGAIATLRFDLREEVKKEVCDWMLAEGLMGMLVLPGMVKAHLWKADNAVSAVETVESKARGGNSAVREWTVAVEGNDVAFVQAAHQWLQQQEKFASSVCEDALVGVYRLRHRLGK